jgi:nucleoside-diphosphate-sugar epimerase
MKVLILGASGHIGKRLTKLLGTTPWAEPVAASRRQNGTASAGQSATVSVDTLDASGLTVALKGFDAVVNCVSGSAKPISEGTRVLVQSALAAGCPRIVHLSTMSVYGPAEGRVREDHARDPSLGWYGRAKCEAEAHIAGFVQQGGQAVTLRPGCVYGPGSELWTSRVGRWLRAGRLGDLGANGDGWSNLVHVDDVCQAVMAALRLEATKGKTATFNLAAPDSPRWNDYFVDLALAIGATPLKRVGPLQLRIDGLLAGPALKLAEMGLSRMGKAGWLPSPMPPGLARLWSQHIRLDPAAASCELKLCWTPYSLGLRSSADWFLGTQYQRNKALGRSWALRGPEWISKSPGTDPTHPSRP